MIARIRILTAGVAFGSTSLCSDHVRGVEGSCAKHLTVEFCMVVMLLIFILIIIYIPALHIRSHDFWRYKNLYVCICSIQSPPHSFIPGLKPSFSANPSHHSLPSFFRTVSTDSPDCIPILLSIPVFFYLFHFSCLPSVLWHCWLGDRKGIRPVKNWAVWCGRGYLSGARCRLACGPADSTAIHCLLLQ